MQVPAPFEYERASTVDDALALLERLGPEARLIAGGHSLLPMMKLRLAAPEHLIDINDLRRARLHPRGERRRVRIGAMTRHRELLESELLGERFPIIHDAERVIADPLVRNRGTIGGALCQADPSEDLGAVCAALGGERGDPRPGRRARGRDERLPPRPLRDRGRRRPRCSSRSGCRCATPRRQRLREGRAARGRLGGRRRRRGRVAADGHDRRRRHRACRGRRRRHPRGARRGRAARQAAVGGAVRRGRGSSPPRTAARTPTSAGPPTTSATSRRN